MARLMLDLVDKNPNYYAAQYYDNDIIGIIYIPVPVYNWYKEATPYESGEYMFESNKQKFKVHVSKELDYNYSRSNCSGFNMRLEFLDNILTIPDSKFNKKAKAYCFQTFVDSCVLNGNNIVEAQRYDFLKSYDTKSKAMYYITKFITGFKNMYKKYCINDETSYNSFGQSYNLFCGDLVFERTLTFKTKTSNNNIALYRFMVICIERG